MTTKTEPLEAPSLVRYLATTLGTYTVGYGATLVLRRPHRLLIGGGIIAAGVALLQRGMMGEWPPMVSRWLGALDTAATKATGPTTDDDKADADTGADMQGEGDYRAARSYDEQLREFIHEGRVEPAARAAAAAVDGPEGPSLRAAEERAKTSPIGSKGNGNGDGNGSGRTY